MSLTELDRRAILSQSSNWLIPEKDDIGFSRLMQPYWNARRLLPHDLFTPIKSCVIRTRAEAATAFSDQINAADPSVFATLLNSEPDAIQRAIEESKTILQLPDNWDDEGASSYEATTWERAVGQLRAMRTLARSCGRTLPAPMIAPSGNGSIDLFWKDDGRTLLINIPPADQMVTYHGERHGNQTTGVIKDIEQRPDLVIWLTSGS